MMTFEQQLVFVQNETDDYKAKMERLAKQLRAIKKIESAGFELMSGDEDYPRDYFVIDRHRLPSLWKSAGKCRVVGKTIPWDFDKKQEIVVTLEPLDEELKMLRFNYRTKFRDGKCKVVEQTNSYKTLVCSK